MAEFDWDQDNIQHIWQKHRVRPEEAEQALTIAPIDLECQFHDGEEYFLHLGITAKLRVLVVVTTWRGDRLRVATAYSASPSLREFYVSESRGDHDT